MLEQKKLPILEALGAFGIGGIFTAACMAGLAYLMANQSLAQSTAWPMVSAIVCAGSFCSGWLMAFFYHSRGLICGAVQGGLFVLLLLGFGLSEGIEPTEMQLTRFALVFVFGCLGGVIYSRKTGGQGSMWVYQETPETAAAKALPEAIIPTAQEEQLKQKNGGVLPETAQEERRSIPAAFSERCRNTPEKAAVRRSKLSRETILLAAAYLLGTFLAGVAAARCVAGDAETLSYYLNCWQSLFSVQDAAGAVRLFRTEFLTVAGALTAVLFLGLSALGPLPIFLFAMLYGTGSGLLSSRLLVDLNPRTAFVLLCVCGIPASLAAGTLCTFGASALQVSGRLCSAAFGRGGQAPSTGTLLGQFARMLFLLLPLCGAAVGMLYLAGQTKLI